MNLKKFTGWIVAIAAACLIVLAVYSYQISNYGYSTLNLVRYLCDGFFVAAVFYLCLGVLLWIADIGGFNGLKYLTYSLVTIFTPRKSRFEERKSYYEFLKEKESTEKRSNKVILITGVIFLVVSIVLSVVFEMLL